MKIFSDRYCKWIGDFDDIDISEILNEKSSIERKYTELATDREFVLKRISYIKLINYIRKPISSQAKREYISTNIIRDIGIKVPKVYGYAISLNPFCKFESMLLMERVEHIGTMADILKNELCPPSDRDKMIKNLLSDIKTFINNNIYHTDAHFNNILITKDYETIWIDNTIKPIKSKKDMDRLIFKFIKRGLLTESETLLLKEVIKI